MIGGYYGKVLRVDLSAGRVWDEKLTDDTCKALIGGAGYGAKVLYDEVGPEVAPLDPDNRIVFGLGPFNGSGIPGSGKFSVTCRSPLTGVQLDTNGGGRFGVGLKKAGYDALVIQGKAEKPVYLFIDDGKAEIRDASGLWGKDAYETVDALVDDLGTPKVSVVSIGPAGEKQIAIACIVADKHSFPGRGGAGAVMGSKNLKAIAARGTQQAPLADAEKVKELRKSLFKSVGQNAKPFRDHGTPGVMVPSEEAGIVPIKNWQQDTWPEGVAKLGGPYFTEYLKITPKACADCPIGCHRHAPVADKSSPVKWLAEGGAAPEYETLAFAGASCLIDDLDAVCLHNDVCNRQGVDTISCGAFIAFAMECYDKGLITKDQLGYELKWGSGEALVKATEQITSGEGYLGSLFTKGIVPAAEAIGGEAINFAQHVRNMDIPAHDPRAFYGMAVTYAVGTRGACHCRAYIEAFEQGGMLFPEIGLGTSIPRDTLEGKDVAVAKIQDVFCLFNSLTQCFFQLFGGFSFTDMLNCVNAITGLDWNAEDLRLAGERIFQMQRVLNVRYGSDAKDDVIPARMYEPAKEGGRANMAPVGLADTLKKYYDYRGWDSSGRPTEDRLKKIGLGQII